MKRDGVAVGRYFYDGEGRRVKKATDLETTIFVYSAGKLVAEYSTRLAAQPSTNYTTTDHLGSPRIITDQFGQVKSRRDFMPFGEDGLVNVGARASIAGYNSNSDNVQQKFTGYQRDDETGLDFAEARMYDNLRGRFTAIDPLLASGKSAAPQTFNRYVYVKNSPLVMTDKMGMVGDYYSRDGSYLGSDGKNDRKVYFARVMERRGNDVDLYKNSIRQTTFEEVRKAQDRSVPTTPGTSNSVRDLGRAVTETPVFEVARGIHKVATPDRVSVSLQAPLMPFGGTATLTSDFDLVVSPDAGREQGGNIGSVPTGGISGGFTWITDTDASSPRENRTSFVEGNSVTAGGCYQLCVGGTLVPGETGNRYGVNLGYSPTPSGSLKFVHGIYVTNLLGNEPPTAAKKPEEK